MKHSIFICRLLAGFIATLSFTVLAASKPEPADFIILDAKVITKTNFTIASAIAVRGDRIVAVGSDRQAERFKGPNTRVINGKGKVVLPGLYDNRVHSYAASVSEIAGPVPVIRSIAEAQDYIRTQAVGKKPKEWILIDRVYPTRLKEGRLPTLAELDAAAPKNPVCWDLGPLVLVNSKALEISKITIDTINPHGGEVVVDRKTHKLTGLLRNARQLLKLPPRARPPTREQRHQALAELYRLYNQQGITSIGESGALPEAIDLFRDLKKSGELTVRINCTRPLTLGPDLETSLTNLSTLSGASAGGAYGPSGVGDDWVRIGALETPVDGDVRNGTAYLRTPWGIGPTYQISELAYTGILYPNAEYFSDVCRAAADQGWQLQGHCTGDAALDFMLHVFQYTHFQTDVTQRRFLVDPGSFQADQDWDMCQNNGVGAKMQPAWLYLDGDSLNKTLGETRMTRFMPLKTWFANRLVIGAGSDHLAGLDSSGSVNPWNPWLGMWIMLTRQTVQGETINPGECLTREQAIRCYTWNNAYLNCEEQAKGSLEPGKLADLIVIDRDPLRCPVDQIKDTKVLLTMVGGKIVWETK